MERPYTVQEIAGRMLIIWPHNIELTLADIRAAIDDLCPHVKDAQVFILPDGRHIIVRLAEQAGEDLAGKAPRDSEAELAAAATAGARWNCF